MCVLRCFCAWGVLWVVCCGAEGGWLWCGLCGVEYRISVVRVSYVVEGARKWNWVELEVGGRWRW